MPPAAVESDLYLPTCTVTRCHVLGFGLGIRSTFTSITDISGSILSLHLPSAYFYRHHNDFVTVFSTAVF